MTLMSSISIAVARQATTIVTTRLARSGLIRMSIPYGGVGSRREPGECARVEREHVDVLIVGAGISGIGAACHLRAECPRKSFAVLEARERIGGTWDLFRYPGIRSDSDMFTLGYSFEPWAEAEAIADGSSILRYLDRTATKHGV